MKSIVVLAALLLFRPEYEAQQREDMNLRGERARVRQGIRSGEITKGEAAKINKEKRDVQTAKRSAKADGVVTAEERREISKQDRQLDRTIHRTKHNNRRR